MEGVATAATQPPPSSSDDQTVSLPVRRIEFHLARKPVTFTPKFSNNPNFKLHTLNPSANSNSNYSLNASSSSIGNRSKAPEPSESFEEAILAFRMPFRRIGAGLENLGNTCFLNSVVQCLTYTEPLVAYLQSGKHQATCRVAGFCALCAVQKHVSRALQSSGRILAPKDLVSNLRCISRTFRNARQEDAHEYMIHLLESMHKCCLPSGVPAESPGAYEKSLVHKIFGGRLRSQVKCLQCSYCSNTFDPFLDLSLEIIKADSLFKALKHFTAPEQLDGGERQYKCERCKQKVRALKQLTVSKAPYILTVHLKRFRSFSGQKIDKKVQFGATLDLKPFVTGDYEGDLSYTLYGVLVHAGWSTHSGHYYCFVRTSNGLWYTLDDNRVFPVSERTVMEQKAYMLFYVRDRKNLAPKKAMDIMQKENLITAMRNASNSCSVPGIISFQKESSSANSRVAVPSGSIVTKCKASEASDVLIQSGPLKPVASIDHSVKPGLNEKLTDTIAPESKNALSSELSMKQELNKNLNNAVLSKAVLIKESSFLNKGDVDIPADISSQAMGLVVRPDSNGELTKSAPLLSAKQPSNPDCQSSVNGTYNKSSKTVDGKVEDKPNPQSNIKVQENATSGTYKVSRVKRSRSKPSAIDGSVSMKSLASAPRRVQMKKVFKSRGVGMHLSTKMLYGASLKLRKSKKCKKMKRQTKDVVQENLPQVSAPLDAGPSTSTGVSCSVDSCSDFTKKVDKMSFKVEGKDDIRNCAISCRSNDLSMDSDDIFETKPSQRVATRSELPAETSLVVEAQCDTGYVSDKQHSLLQNGLLDGGTRNLEETAVARWEGIDSPVIVESNGPEVFTIGHVLDEWDEEYDRGKRKKVRGVKNDFDGPNLFQEIASKKAKLKAGKGQSIHVNEPFRI